jgi:hypothetical protein
METFINSNISQPAVALMLTLSVMPKVSFSVRE